jgi:hypothetical protein
MNKKSILKKSLELFELEKIDRDIFSWNGKNVGYKRKFGGPSNGTDFNSSI